METIGTIFTALITSFVVVALVVAYEAGNILERQCVEVSYRDTVDSFNLSLVSRGINPGFIKTQLDLCDAYSGQKQNSLAKKWEREGKASTALIVDGGDFGRNPGFGVVVLLESGSGYKGHKSNLNVPSFRISGELNYSHMPLSDLLIPAEENPSGTYYRYEIDGACPNRESPIWRNEPFSPQDVPNKICLRAFHPDSIYEPSDVVEITFSIPTPVIKLSREDSSLKTSVSFSEISTLSNRIVLTEQKSPSFFIIEYRVYGETVWHKYEGPFHIPLHFWKSSKIVLEVKTTAKSPSFKQEHRNSFELTVSKTKLPGPVFNPNSGAEVIIGNIIQVKKADDRGELKVAVNGHPTNESPSITEITAK